MHRVEAWLLLGIVSLLAGCRAADSVRGGDYTHLVHAVNTAPSFSEAGAEVLDPVVDELSGPQPVDVFIRFALSQNPTIDGARKRLEAAAMQVPQAASLADPMLDIDTWPFYPHTPQTASGRMTVDVMVAQQVPWFGKLRTRASVEQAEVSAAQAELAAAELEVIEQVKLAYYELYYVQRVIQITQQDRRSLADIVQIAETLYRTGRVSQQDVLRLQAELSSVDSELLRMRQMQFSAQAELAQTLHISPETPVAALPELPTADLPGDLDRLYQQAVEARPELHAILFEIERDRRRVELAELDYRPDVTFKFGWSEMTTNRAIAPSADGIDNLTAGLTMNLPIYRQRLDAGVREAEAQAVATARRYDALKDETQREVKQLFTRATSQREMLRLFDDSIIPKTEQAFEVALREYQVGEAEFADLIANWRELLRFQITQAELESQFRQSIASLERVIGGYSYTRPEVIEPGFEAASPRSITTSDEENND